MSKRERIILIVMAIAVVYGLYIFLYSAPSGTSMPTHGGKSRDLNTFIVDMAKKITDNRQFQNDEHIVAKASAEWTQNPFSGPQSVVQTRLEIPVLQQKKASERPQHKDFFYTGYLNIGTSTMAIINGRERGAGETLDPTVFYVKSIFPTWVEIGIQGETDTIILPLEKPGEYSMETEFRGKVNEGETR